jgi:uncharacterized protein (TIGR00369 family)
MTLDELRALVAQAEFHKFLNLDVVSCDAEAGAVTFRLPYDDAFTLFPKVGNYHGGIIASLADIAGTMACSVRTGRPTPTIDLRVDYLRSPCRVDLIAEARALRAGRSVGTSDVTICGEDGSIYAVARGTFSTAGA